MVRLGVPHVLLFILELGLIAAVGFGVFALTDSALWPIVSIVVLTVLWGLLLAPRSRVRPRWPWHSVIAHVLFLAACALLFLAGHGTLAWSYLGLIVLSVLVTAKNRDQLRRESLLLREEARAPRA